MDKPWVIRLGNILIFIGVSMWGPYAIGKYLLGWDITDRQLLPYHLAVIIPGMMLRNYSAIFGRIGRFLSGKKTEKG